MSALEKQIAGDHYKRWKIQPAEFAMANDLNYCQCLVLRYMMRYKFKNGPEDIDKAIHALELLKEFEFPFSNSNSPMASRIRPGTTTDWVEP